MEIDVACISFVYCRCLFRINTASDFTWKQKYLNAWFSEHLLIHLLVFHHEMLDCNVGPQQAEICTYTVDKVFKVIIDFYQIPTAYKQLKSLTLNRAHLLAVYKWKLVQARWRNSFAILFVFEQEIQRLVEMCMSSSSSSSTLYLFSFFFVFYSFSIEIDLNFFCKFKILSSLTSLSWL